MSSKKSRIYQKLIVTGFSLYNAAYGNSLFVGEIVILFMGDVGSEHYVTIDFIM